MAGRRAALVGMMAVGACVVSLRGQTAAPLPSTAPYVVTDPRDTPTERAEMQARRDHIVDYFQHRLEMSDDEFRAIRPNLARVVELQGDAIGRFSAAPPAGNASEVQRKAADLIQTLATKDARPDQIASQLKALKDARNQAKSELSAAQEDLRKHLSPRQEAILYLAGILN